MFTFSGVLLHTPTTITTSWLLSRNSGNLRSSQSAPCDHTTVLFITCCDDYWPARADIPALVNKYTRNFHVVFFTDTLHHFMSETAKRFISEIRFMSLYSSDNFSHNTMDLFTKSFSINAWLTACQNIVPLETFVMNYSVISLSYIRIVYIQNGIHSRWQGTYVQIISFVKNTHGNLIQIVWSPTPRQGQNLRIVIPLWSFI